MDGRRIGRARANLSAGDPLFGDELTAEIDRRRAEASCILKFGACLLRDRRLRHCCGRNRVSRSMDRLLPPGTVNLIISIMRHRDPHDDQPDKRRPPYGGPPMTLANMRAQGVRSLSVSCWLCHHGSVLLADQWPNEVTLPSFGPRMVCTSVRDRWRRRAAELAGARRAGEPDRSAVVAKGPLIHLLRRSRMDVDRMPTNLPDPQKWRSSEKWDHVMAHARLSEGLRSKIFGLVRVHLSRPIEGVPGRRRRHGGSSEGRSADHHAR